MAGLPGRAKTGAPEVMVDLFSLLPIFGGDFAGAGVDAMGAPLRVALTLEPMLAGRLWQARLRGERELVGGSVEEVVLFTVDARGKTLALAGSLDHPGLQSHPLVEARVDADEGACFTFGDLGSGPFSTQFRLAFHPGGALSWGWRHQRPEGEARESQLRLERCLEEA